MSRSRISTRWVERIAKNRYNINDFFEPEVLAGHYGMPKMKPTNYIPKKLFHYDERSRFKKDWDDGELGDTAIHFFSDDSVFESVWLRAHRFPHVPKVVIDCGATLTPDFSLYRDWPLAVQIWNTYRNRHLGCLWQSQGIEVIPTVSWSDEKSYKFCFDGIPKESTVAITTNEIGDSEAKRLFHKGFMEMLKQLNPRAILVYGKKMNFMESVVNSIKNTEIYRFEHRLCELKKVRE